MQTKICVLGLGYIGFPTALMFAKAGFDVIGVDVNEKVIAAIHDGRLHLEENGLDVFFQDVRSNHLFQAMNAPVNADAFIVAVPTPINEDHTANLSYVVSAVDTLLPLLSKGNTVIIESTIPPRTVDDIVAPLLQNAGWQVGEDIYLAHCPERVLPGKILRELVENNRIVGGYNAASADKAAALYESFVKGEIVRTTAVSAEMIKLMENTYRDVNIALANELAIISSNLGIDALEVIRYANKHPRVNLHSPGPGVGGHCIAVDPYFIIEKAPFLTPLMTTAREINNAMPEFVAEQVERIAGRAPDRTIAVFGVTYKGNVDDIRESPALEVISLLEMRGFRVKVHDPHVSQENAPFPLYSPADALQGSDCMLVLADHNEFKDLNEQLLTRMNRAVIFDTKNCIRLKSAVPAALYNYGNLHEAHTAESAEHTKQEIATAME
ncbi:nucleotide sugar dehydrogenase [Paenibacillus contaminans]|uniref:UDP-N-acetyl-D-mannosamine dehydrogenase n=1 Tax=Paenibacillus contaminans TaxID=450362 RepID=A0A329MW69_9BACL|nr:nucleotide sugar dehydrogenase [Paenibacillus contaminans]RAV22107.1 UDP-N-acetyl-D-mannosamine dehydrogenase [Paenibacillus contaminans]